VPLRRRPIVGWSTSEKSASWRPSAAHCTPIPGEAAHLNLNGKFVAGGGRSELAMQAQFQPATRTPLNQRAAMARPRRRSPRPSGRRNPSAGPARNPKLRRARQAEAKRNPSWRSRTAYGVATPSSTNVPSRSTMLFRRCLFRAWHHREPLAPDRRRHALGQGGDRRRSRASGIRWPL
jgi:hypothetical protein